MTIYAYPWDMARLGVERCLHEISSTGIEAIDLAATYHPIDALSPRYGVSRFTDARGAVYFPARRERYGRIRPHVHSAELSGIWPEVAWHVGRTAARRRHFRIRRRHPARLWPIRASALAAGEAQCRKSQ